MEVHDRIEQIKNLRAKPIFSPVPLLRPNTDKVRIAHRVMSQTTTPCNKVDLKSTPPIYYGADVWSSMEWQVHQINLSLILRSK